MVNIDELRQSGRRHSSKVEQDRQGALENAQQRLVAKDDGDFPLPSAAEVAKVEAHIADQSDKDIGCY